MVRALWSWPARLIGRGAVEALVVSDPFII